MIVLTLVRDLRIEIPMLGTRKLLFMLTAEFVKHEIKMGRDQKCISVTEEVLKNEAA